MTTIKRLHGFTLVELVTVILLLGILAAVALPRVTNSADFAGRAFRDTVWSAVSHARRTAVASRHFTCVSVSAGMAGAVTIARDVNDPDTLTKVDCTMNLALPGHPVPVLTPVGVVVTGGAALVFNPLGQLVSQNAPQTLATDASIAIAGQPAITVVAQTGAVQ